MMRKLLRFFSLLAILAGASSAIAADYQQPITISDSQTLASPSSNWGKFTSITTMGYWNPNDGGGATFNLGTAPSSVLGVLVTITGSAHNGTSTLDTLSGDPTSLHWQKGEHITDTAGRIPANTYITGVFADHITISQLSTGNSTGDTLTVDCDNGGTIRKDGGGHCFFAQTPSPSLALWGLAKGSAYDAQALPTTVSYADTRTAAAFAVMPAQYGQNDFDTAGVNLAYAQDIVVPSLGEFGCGATPGEFQPNALYNNLPGTLYLAHGADVSLGAGNNSGSEFGNCWVEPEWLLNPAKATFSGGRTDFNYPFQSFDDMQAVRRNQMAGGDDAVHCQGNSCMKVHDITAIGFDNPFWGDKSGNFIGQNLFADGNVGFYFNGGGGETITSRSDVEPILTRNPGGTLTSSEAFDITNISCSTHNTNAAGHCVIELTLQQISGGPSTNDIHDTTFLPDGVTPSSYTASSFNIKNSLGNPNGWNMGNAAIKVISQDGANAVVDILGSDFGSTSGGGSLISVTGQWQANSNTLLIRGNADKIGQIHSGQIVTVSGGSGFPSGTVKVLSPVYYQGPDPTDAFAFSVQIDRKTSAAQGSDVTISFDNGAFAASGHVCNASNQGYCLNFDVSTFGYAGYSTAGIATARLPSSFGQHRATSYLCDNAPGVTLDVPFSYGHHNHYAAIDCPRVALTAERADNNKFNDDHGENFFQAFGASNAVTVSDITGSAAGHGYVDDRWTLTDDVQTTSTEIAALGTGLGIIHLASTSGFAANGDTVAFCIALTATNGCDTKQQYEIVKGQIGAMSAFVVNLRGDRGTAPQQFPSGTVYVVRQLVGPNKGCMNIKGTGAAITDSYLAILEAIHGCTQMTNTRANQTGFGFVGDGAVATQLNGNYWPNTTLQAANENARATISGNDNQCLDGCPNGKTPFQPSGAAATPTGWTALGAGSAGALTGTFTNWPRRGYAIVGSETFGFTWDPAASDFEVTVRGACNTTAASHTDGDSTIYFTETPCPVSGSASYWRRGDGLNDELVMPTGGSLARWLSDLLADRISVSSFGAYGLEGGSSDDGPAFARAFAAAAANHTTTVYVTKDLHYIFPSGLSIPAGYKLQCLGPYPSQSTTSGGLPDGHHKTLPFTLLFPAGASLNLSASGPRGAEDGCTIAYKPMYDTAEPTDWPSLQTTLAAFGGTGVIVGGDAASITNSMIVGFDQCYSSVGHDNTQLVNVYGDCNKRFKLQDSQFVVGNWDNVSAFPLLTNRLTFGLISLPIATLTNAGGIYRAVLASPCTTANCPRTGDKVFIGADSSTTAFPVGAESANGWWLVTKVDNSTYDLTGTQTAGTVTTGDSTLGSYEVCNIAELLSDNIATHIRKNQAVTSADFTGGTIVNAFDPYMGCAWLSTKATGAHTGAAITFTDNAYVAGANPWFMRLNANIRPGPAFAFDNVNDGKAVNLHSYNSQVSIEIGDDTRSMSLIAPTIEYENSLLDPNVKGFDIEGAAQGNTVIGGVINAGGGLGTPIYNNQAPGSGSPSPNKFIGVDIGGFHSVSGDADIPYIYHENGNLIVSDSSMGPQQNGNIFVADGTKGYQMLGGVFKSVDFYMQSENAAGTSCYVGIEARSSTHPLVCPRSTVTTLTGNVGGGQAGATPITTRIARVNGCASDHCGVMLPPGTNGVDGQRVVNATTHIVDVYADLASGDSINNQATNVPLSIPPRINGIDNNVDFVTTSLGHWHANPVSGIGITGNASDSTNGVSGSGHIVLDTSPVVTTPTLHAPTVDGAAVIPTASAPGYVSGRYYPPPYSTIATNYAMSANVLYSEPFYVAKATTFTKIAIDVTTAPVGNGNCEFAIYANNNGAPGALLQDLGNVAVTTGTTGTTGLTGLTIALNPGWYFPAFGCSNAPQVEAGAAANGLSAWLLGVTSFVNQGMQISVAWTYSAGAPPNPFGTVTYNATTAQPLIELGL